jgi:hypothetical protein
MNWNAAYSYCDNLSEKGHNDWRIPDIDELRALIINCPSTETGGSCGVGDGCYSFSPCFTDANCVVCSEDTSGKYSLFGDTGWLWSVTALSSSPNHVWSINFSKGEINYKDHTTTGPKVRCLR